MHKNATKYNKTLRKWCKNKHGASKFIDTFETYQSTTIVKNSVGASITMVYVATKREGSIWVQTGLYATGGRARVGDRWMWALSA
jgi:hypothetical protein